MYLIFSPSFPGTWILVTFPTDHTRRQTLYLELPYSSLPVRFVPAPAPSLPTDLSPLRGSLRGLVLQKKKHSQSPIVSGSKKVIYLRQHSVLDWSPTSILSGPCDACLRGSDETRKVHRGMAADERKVHKILHILSIFLLFPPAGLLTDKNASFQGHSLLVYLSMDSPCQIQ